jgi:hypothetical protein
MVIFSTTNVGMLSISTEGDHLYTKFYYLWLQNSMSNPGSTAKIAKLGRTSPHAAFFSP